MSWPDWTELSDFIKALAALGWPVALIILLFVFKKEVKGLVSGRKLKKGKLFGQAFELEEELNRLEQSTKGLEERAAAAPVPPAAEQPAPERPSLTQDEIQQNVYDVTRQVLAEAGTSPKAALMSLAAQIEAELRHVVEERGGHLGPRSAFRDSITALRQLEVPEELLRSMLRFR